MSSVYAMQRANGDWFALEDEGRLRVPVFHTRNQAMMARSRDSGMECFRPAILDERAVDDLTAGEGNVGYWLVENPSIKLRHGRPLDHVQINSLLSELAAESKN